jgi:H/ACA ribonucleoprotein complex subunit 2
MREPKQPISRERDESNDSSRREFFSHDAARPHLISVYHAIQFSFKFDVSSNLLFTMGDDDSKKAESSSKTYEERVTAVNVISHPLASKKSTKKAHKLVKKAAGLKHIRRGVKEVIKALRKGETGIAIMAGDIYPVDVISHLPVYLEEKNLPYIFVPSKQDLGAAASTKRPTSIVLIRTPNKDFEGQDLYDALVKEAKEYNPSSVVPR